MPEEEKPEVRLSISEHLGILYMRSFLKLFAIIFIALEFAIGRFPNMFIALIFLFVVYFTMPTSYSRSQPYRSTEAWFRMFIGLLIAIALFNLLSPGENLLLSLMPITFVIAFAAAAGFAAYTSGNKLLVFVIALAFSFGATALNTLLYPAFKLPNAIPLFFLTLAFYATAPKVSKDEEEGEKIIVVGEFGGGKYGKVRGALTGDNMENFGNAFFAVLIFSSFAPVLLWVKGGLQIVLTIILAFSGLIGYISGREARPYLGIIVLSFSILAFSFQYTGTVGTAIFGTYWTPIYNFGTETLGPIGQSLDAASRQINYAMCTITAGPGVCEAIINPPSQAAGSTQALEMTNFEAINYRSATPEIDPKLPLIGTIQLENLGDFKASSVDVKLSKPIIFDPQKASLNDPSAAMKELASDGCIFDSCIGANAGAGECSWTDPFQPKDIKILTFKCGAPSEYNKWASADVNSCECRDPRNGQKIADSSCDTGSDCGLMKGKTYGIGGQTKCICVSAKDEFSSYCGGLSSIAPPAYCTIEDSACKKTDGTWNCESPACSTACNGVAGKAIKKYTNAGWNLRIGFDYSFKYFSNVSLPVKVMKKSEFIAKLQSKQVTLQDVAPAYSGGPVSVGIDLGKQPIRTEDSTIGRIYIKNNGNGKVNKGAVLRLAIPAANSNLKFLQPPKVISTSFSFKGKSISAAVNSCNFVGGTAELECPLTSDLLSGEEGTITFDFKYGIEGTATEKSTIFVGGLDYTYKNSKYMSFPIVATPSQ